MEVFVGFVIIVFWVVGKGMVDMCGVYVNLMGVFGVQCCLYQVGVWILFNFMEKSEGWFVVIGYFYYMFFVLKYEFGEWCINVELGFGWVFDYQVEVLFDYLVVVNGCLQVGQFGVGFGKYQYVIGIVIQLVYQFEVIVWVCCLYQFDCVVVDFVVVVVGYVGGFVDYQEMFVFEDYCFCG